MTCEICDTATATMWVQDKQGTSQGIVAVHGVVYGDPLVSCDDCGPQLGYKILAPLTSVQCHG